MVVSYHSHNQNFPKKYICLLIYFILISTLQLIFQLLDACLYPTTVIASIIKSTLQEFKFCSFQVHYPRENKMQAHMGHLISEYKVSSIHTQLER